MAPGKNTDAAGMIRGIGGGGNTVGKPGVYRPSLEGHKPMNVTTKNTTDRGLARGSRTTQGNPSHYVLGDCPD